MLIEVRRSRDLSFAELMKLYREDNLENGQEFWPEETEDRQLELAEQEFFQYLQDVFFLTPDAAYYLWQEQGKYVSALRLEPYKDGMLITALVTAPEQRNKGFAKKLIECVIAQVDDKPIYSHVGKSNVASQRTHESCGFQKIMDYAVYSDGSVLHSCNTYRYKKGVQVSK